MMKTSVLIPRLVRAIETGGEIGDGPLFATEYNGAVQKVNERLETVQVALDSSQFSEASRLMEEAPSLLPEIGLLEFLQLPSWRLLCGEKGWPQPLVVDHTLLEQILFVYNSAAMLQPVLRQYRKAVRLKDDRMIVRCLRRLTEIDPSTDWKNDLQRAETTLQRNLVESFRRAKETGDDDGATKSMEELLDPVWSIRLAGPVEREILSYKDERLREKLERELSEDLAILHSTPSENWNGEKVRSLLEHIDELKAAGVPIPQEEETFVASLRQARTAQIEAERKEKEWGALQDRLHAAVEKESPEEVRQTLADPLFLDREPDELLLRKARQVISNAEDERARKIRLIIGTSCLLLLALLFTSLFFFREKSFRDKRRRYGEELSWIAKGALAHVNLSNALEKVKIDPDADRLADLITRYDGELRVICKEREARLASIDTAFSKLAEYRANGWRTADGLCEGQFQTLERLILPEDVELAKQLAEWRLELATIKENAHARAVSSASEGLVLAEGEVEKALETMKGHFIGTAEKNMLSSTGRKLADWKNRFGGNDALLDSKHEGLTRKLALAEKHMGDAQSALDRMANASSLKEVCESRETLRRFYKDYQGVSSLLPLPVPFEEMERYCKNRAPSQTAWRDAFLGQDKAFDFKSFLDEEVLVYNDRPEIRSLYGVYRKGASYYLAYSIGKAVLDEIGRDTQVGEDLLTADQFERVTQVDIPDRKANVIVELVPSSIEISDIVDRSRGISESAFRDMIFGRLKWHLSQAPESQAVENNGLRFMSINRFPGYRRVQLVATYLDWLDQMGSWPKVPSATAFRQHCTSLASQIAIEGVEDSFAWLCLSDQRVRQRNAEAMAYLASVPPEEVNGWRVALGDLLTIANVSNWKIVPVGKTRFIPTAPTLCSWSYFKDVDKTAPLYVFRSKGGNRFYLEKVAVPQGGSHARLREYDLIPGEPLFQVVANSRACDALAEFKKVQSRLTPDILRLIPWEESWLHLAPARR